MNSPATTMAPAVQRGISTTEAARPSHSPKPAADGFSSLLDHLAHAEDQTSPSVRARRAESDAGQESALRGKGERKRDPRADDPSDQAGTLAVTGAEHFRDELPGNRRLRSEDETSLSDEPPGGRGRPADGDESMPISCQARAIESEDADDATAVANESQDAETCDADEAQDAGGDEGSTLDEGDPPDLKAQGVELEAKSVRTIARELAQAAARQTKLQLTQADSNQLKGTATDDSAGTDVKSTATAEGRGIPSAQMTAQMKNTPDQNTFAGLSGKFLPEVAAITAQELQADRQVAETDPRVTIIPARADWGMSVSHYSDSVGALDDSPPPAGQLMLERLTNLSHMMLREVQTLRQTTAKELDVVLRPDAHTEISMHVRWHNGQLEAKAHCRLGDYTALRDGWTELQANLMRNGVRLAPLAPPMRDTGAGGYQSSGSDRRESGTHPQRDFAEFEKGVASLAGRRQANRSGPTHVTHSPRHLLESWA